MRHHLTRTGPRESIAVYSLYNDINVTRTISAANRHSCRPAKRNRRMSLAYEPQTVLMVQYWFHRGVPQPRKECSKRVLKSDTIRPDSEGGSQSIEPQEAIKEPL
jgi:hypothetical protein